jgi:hypothetical protein
VVAETSTVGINASSSADHNEIEQDPRSERNNLARSQATDEVRSAYSKVRWICPMSKVPGL